MRSGIWGSESRFCILYCKQRNTGPRGDRAPHGDAVHDSTQQDTRARRQSDPAAQRSPRVAPRGVARHTHP